MLLARTGQRVALSRWGLLDAALAGGAPPSRRVTFGVDGELTVRAIKDRAGVDVLVAPRRHALDALLAGAARDAGAEVLTEVTATGVLRDASGRVTGITTRDRSGRTGELTGRFIVGADGLRSSIARFVGAKTVESFASDAGLFYAYVASPAWDGYEFHLAESSFAGVFPTHDGQACVWLSRPVPLLRSISRAGSRRADVLVRELLRLAPSIRSLTPPLHRKEPPMTTTTDGRVNGVDIATLFAPIDAVLDSDHPAVLVGTDHGPTPAEYLLHALGACL